MSAHDEYFRTMLTELYVASTDEDIEDVYRIIAAEENWVLLKTDGDGSCLLLTLSELADADTWVMFDDKAKATKYAKMEEAA
jgi:hypothetical protein